MERQNSPVEIGGSPCSIPAGEGGLRHFRRAKSQPWWYPHRRPPCASHGTSGAQAQAKQISGRDGTYLFSLKWP